MVQIFADSNRARLRMLKEDDNAWGTTPAAGRTREVRYTGSTINANKETATSEEIRADRMVADYIETGARSAGEINIEYSAGSHDDLMEAFVYGAWTRPMTFDSVKGTALAWASASVLHVKGVDVTNYFFTGRRIKTSGFLKSANNAYWQIDSITWNAGANRTEITVAETTGEAENGSAYTAMIDANDVIVLNNTDIRAGTAGESAFDSNGTNAFAGAIAAGQLHVGQKLFIDGLGIETGTITFSAVPAVGSRVTVSDGDKTLVFQFGGSVPPSAEGVDLGADVTEQAAKFAAELNAKRVRGELQVSATAALGVVTVKNLLRTGGQMLETLDSGNAIAVVDFAGGNATLHGVFKVDTMTDDKITVTPSPDTFDNAGELKVTIKGSMLRNPSDADEITPQSFTIETGFEDVDQYWITDGLRVGTFSYNIASNSILTGSFGFNGRQTKRQGTTKLGAAPYTVLETTSTPVANATVNVGAIIINGEELSTAIQSITMNGNNNLRDQNAVSYKFPAGIGAGRMEITGNLVAYFADGSLWDKFIEHRTVSIEFSIEDVLGNHYEYTVPAANFTTDTVNPPGGNQDVMENMEFGAKRDAVTGCEIQIDRYSSILATTA
ncbi:tail tube protein [Brevundimonas phage vB_BpoS-Marchewka]|uniref:Tail tube protein n=1 Tax=Brevundimonas phage vB_BpoS-Marchewka TaxID=2948604 RepID=A0A9E7STG5_9CAUD|nr:tail tube protein [Brevundimonas phage vB_BpoS-Marchewka]UTC29515.1 tail tube protein [Brevundimonas phage vB_BpoS-Bambus]